MKEMLNNKDFPLFKQPFLCLAVRVNDQGEGGVENWTIDVDGKVDLFFNPDTKKPTKLLLDLCENMASSGFRVREYGKYIGSAGPSHILRNGAFFRRMHKDEATATPEPSLTYRENW